MTRRQSMYLTLTAAGSVGLALLAWVAWTFFPSPADAYEILQNAADQKTVVSTYKITRSAGHGPQSPGDPETYESSGSTLVVEGKGLYSVTETPGGPMEYLLYRDKQYYRAANSGPWREMRESTANFEFPTLDSVNHSGLVESLDEAEVVGTETFQGVQTTKIVARRNQAEKVEAIWGNVEDLDRETRVAITDPRNQMLAGTEIITVWVGKENGLIYRYMSEGTYPAEGELLAFTTWETITFSDFNGDLSIPDASTLEVEENSGSSSDGAEATEPTPIPTPTPEGESDTSGTDSGSVGP